MKRSKVLLGSIPLLLVLLALTGMTAAAPAPAEAAICPLIGCVDDDYCRRDRDCDARPGGVCNLFCPTRGCCGYSG
jgi:hypothetical protein